MRSGDGFSFLSEDGPLTVVRSALATPAQKARVLPAAAAMASIENLCRGVDRESRAPTLRALHAVLVGDNASDHWRADSGDLVAVLLDAVQRGELLVVDGWQMGDTWTGAAHVAVATAAESEGRDTGEVRVARAIMSGRDEVAVAGGSYVVMPASLWRAWAGRQDFEIVPREQASAVLQLLTGGAREERLREAAALLADTRVPIVQTGLYLVRRLERRSFGTAPAEASTTPSQLRQSRRGAFQLVVVEAGSRAPLSEVALRVQVPDGSIHDVKTDRRGRVVIPDLPSGVCLVESVIDGVRVAEAYVPRSAAPIAGAPSGQAPGSARSGHLVEVTRHRVATGETPATIAEQTGVSWARICQFNWGTCDPAELEVHYRDAVGCRRKRPDGSGYVFDDRDEPGIILIPQKWEARLAVGPLHEIYAEPLRPFFLSLDNDAGLPIPAARYEVRFADGSEWKGVLGRSGIARIDGVPEGPVVIRYPDELDLLAKSLAVSVRQALGEQATAPIFSLLMQSQEVVDRAVAAYERYLNDLTGKGLAADIDQAITDPDARRPLLGLCALAGVPVEGANAVAAGAESAP